MRFSILSHMQSLTLCTLPFPLPPIHSFATDFGDDLPPRSRGSGGPRKKHRVPEAVDEPLVPHEEGDEPQEEAAEEEIPERQEEVAMAVEENEVFKGISDGLIWNCPIGRHEQGELPW